MSYTEFYSTWDCNLVGKKDLLSMTTEVGEDKKNKKKLKWVGEKWGKWIYYLGNDWKDDNYISHHL